MKRKYIDELNIKYIDTPQGFNPGDAREDYWKEQREEYGFDERETWALDYSLKLWLYERLCMYNEIDFIDKTYHKFEYKGEIITFQDCLNRMIEGLKLDLTIDDYAEERNDKEIQEKINDIFPILDLCMNCLWW